MTEPLIAPERDCPRSSRALRTAGAAIALAAGLVLLGWAVDIAAARSFVPGWRVMVPTTALCFGFLGTALAISSVRRQRLATSASVALAVAGATIALATLHEYATGVRSGIETWGGLWHFDATPEAGRMSPMTALVMLTLALATGAAMIPGALARATARLAAGTALFATWLAVLAVSVDVTRLANEPRFPGMAVPTLIFAVLTAACVLAMTTVPHPTRPVAGSGVRWPTWSALGAFIAPPLLSRAHAAILQLGVVEPQLLTAAVAFGFSLLLALAVWRYAARLARAHRAQERALTRLEERVAERTQALSASNDELRRHQDTLQEADRRKDEFLALLAHELRNPLAPIRTAAHIVGAAQASPEQQRRAGVIIERQVGVMRRLIDDLLEVNRITAGTLQVRPARATLTEVVDLAVSTTRPICDEFQHELTVTLPDEPIYVDADVARLAQAFGNLLHNACKFTPPHGHIALIAARGTNGKAEITVRDDGIGIEPAFLPRLFDRFSQASPGMGRTQGGLGLGLSLVQGIVGLHGGTVTAFSEGPGTGSAFVVRLPMAPAPQPTEPPAGDLIAARTDARRVIVVDDNEDNATTLATLLALDGHDVQTAFDGADALAQAEAARPDVMLVDLGMPGLDGCEVGRRVRARPWGDAVLLVAQTGFGQGRDLERSHAAGFDAHLTKPIDVEHLRHLLRVHVPRAVTDATA